MDAQLLARRLEREKQARKAAEAFIEAKSLELYVAQQKQEQAFLALQMQTEATNAVNEQLQQEVNRRVQAEALERLLEQIVLGHPLQAILARLAQLVELRTSQGRCFIATQNGQQLFHADMPETTDMAPAPPVHDASPADAAPEAQGNRQVRLLEDLSQDPVWRPHWESGALQGLRAGWSVPLVTADGQRVGDFAIHHPRAQAPAESDVEWMLMLSELAALAIGHRGLTESLAHQAHYDALTDLPNRVLFGDRLEQAIAQARREHKHVGVLFLDLDGFKHINDTLGHEQGDEVLREVTRRLKGLLRQFDTLARMGGDEFMVVLPALKTPRHAARVAQKCLDALRAPMYLDGHEVYVGGSIGISIYPGDALDAERLRRNADLAMYKVKAGGKNGFAFFTPDLTSESLEWLDLRSDLHHALEGGQFVLHYQPQFRLDGSLLGLEALLRWQHPRWGWVPPATFIPIAEESGLIVAIGTWVLREACRQMAAWRQSGCRDQVISVNVSVMQLEHRDCVDTVAQVLQQTGLPPALLELEMTESLVMQNVQQATTRLQQLRKLGVRLAVDDFGTGYSSLNYLQHLPIDTLKIDRTFIHDIDTSRSLGPGIYSPVLRTIVDLGHSLGLRVIAEGVETELQAEVLRELGCDAMQGHLFAEPMPVKDCERFLQRREAATSLGR